eukprot:7405727-Pyramimonas_sp.AAC.1
MGREESKEQAKAAQREKEQAAFEKKQPLSRSTRTNIRRSKMDRLPRIVTPPVSWTYARRADGARNRRRCSPANQRGELSLSSRLYQPIPPSIFTIV